MNRREFIALLGGAAAWPLAARAQQVSKLPTIGFMSSTSAAPFAHLVAAFRDSLKATGFVEGQNVAIEFRWADGQYDRLQMIAAELAAALPLAARAQQPAMPVIGFLHSGSAEPYATRVAAFRKGL